MPVFKKPKLDFSNKETKMIHLTLSDECHTLLANDAKQNKRSMKAHAEYVLFKALKEGSK